MWAFAVSLRGVALNAVSMSRRKFYLCPCYMQLSSKCV
uniref:Uncharacterized protein n=1 Tax=Arundo donax TaxID=35708 RepID=A0A0A9A397_ARUDO